jgi:F0F1-type ATP synthase assembly protein I
MPWLLCWSGVELLSESIGAGLLGKGTGLLTDVCQMNTPWGLGSG